ncbi:T9SS type A sorting domain-containing protein [Chitinophaga rhizosphaerae]|uniref:T9SS type A sorting domain-containing protein n=1 Tax=Chitinophaga rhizosphaerae TaxID=1864947 RepID=UPI000F803DBC|nr:T9SS type A sorting domain-containing protein [Chitinophaga rhizosphaerae]
MSALFIYLLKANIALCLFYLAYRLGLRRMTFYTLNRFFLLGGIAFSSMFPLVDVNDFFSRNVTLAAQVTYYVPDWTTLQKVESFTVWTLLEYTFWAGVAVMASRFLVQMVSLLVLHLRTEPDRLFGQEVRRMKGSVTPFSFFRKIYVNPELHTETELFSIVKHEQVHVKEWHTADIMMGEINNVFYWFNPGAWLMKSAIRENLEFLADRAILRSGINRKEYQYSLIQVNASQYAAGITNSFNLSHIKNRIFMMNKSRTSRIQLYRYGVLGCIVCGVLLTLNYTKAGAVVHDALQEVKTALVPGAAEKDSVSSSANGGDTFVTVKGTIPSADSFITIEGKFGATDNLMTGEGKPVTAFGNAVTYQGEPTPDTVTPRSGQVVEQPKLAGKVSGEQMKPTVVEGKPVPKKNVSEILMIGPSGRKAEPLIVVDGIPQKSDGTGTPLKNMDPNNIESVSVLKDDAATSIYGPSGKDGVILITTKKPGSYKGRPLATTVVKNEYDEVREERVWVDSVTGKRNTVITVTGTPRPQARSGAAQTVREAPRVDVSRFSPVASPDSSARRARTISGVRSMELKQEPQYRLRTGNSKDTVYRVVVDAYSRKMASTVPPAASIQTEHYPNPTNGVVTFAYSLSKPGKGNIRVTDINGREIFRKSIDGLTGSQKEQINLSGKPAGSYIVTLTHDHATMTSRIVKQ